MHLSVFYENGPTQCEGYLAVTSVTVLIARVDSAVWLPRQMSPFSLNVPSTSLPKLHTCWKKMPTPDREGLVPPVKGSFTALPTNKLSKGVLLYVLCLSNVLCHSYLSMSIATSFSLLTS